MFNSKNIIIHNTSSAALFQLTDIYFDNLTSLFNNLNNNHGDIKTEEKNIMNEKILQNYDIYKLFIIILRNIFNFNRNAITLIRDFIQIANGIRPQWLPNSNNAHMNYKNICYYYKKMINTENIFNIYIYISYGYHPECYETMWDYFSKNKGIFFHFTNKFYSFDKKEFYCSKQ